MATISSSLKDRGREILGLTRRGNHKPQAKDVPIAAQAAAHSPPIEPSPAAPNGDPMKALERNAREAREREIDRLLDAEAELATGNSPAHLDPGSWTPAALDRAVEMEALPAEEWVAPITEPVTPPAAAPPPSPALESRPSAGPGPVPETILPDFSEPPAAPPPPPSAPRRPQPRRRAQPKRNQAAAQNADLLPLPGPDEAEAAELIGAPEAVPLTPEQEAELLTRPDVQEQLSDLDQAIDSLYQRILRDNVSVNQTITDWCHNMLAAARTIVTYRRVSELARAEWIVEQVRARLDRAGQSVKQTRMQALIMAWGLVWFFLFVYLVFNPIRLGPDDGFLNPQVFSRSLFFGGIGAVAAVFYHLIKYVRDRSFDSKYLLSYVGKPFMGMILGSMVYLTVFVLMRVLGMTPIGMPEADPQSVATVLYTALLFFIAMAVGFKENLAFSLLNRVIKRIFGDEDKTSQPVA